MALVALVKGKDTPTPNKGATGNIPTDSPQGAGENFVPYSSRIIDGAKDVNPMGSPRGRHLDNGRDVLPQGSPIGRHINSGNTILPQGSPQGRHTQSPLGVGTIRKSPLAGE